MTTSNTPAHSRFRTQLQQRANLLGTFLKIPTGDVTEWLGAIGYDFVVIDQEHAAFDRGTTNAAILAARAANIAALIRPPSDDPATILAALDMGAAGILVPHVGSAGQAEGIVAACLYAGGGRGFALATRAAGYGQVPTAAHIAKADSEVAIIAQIEDAAGLQNVEEIVKVSRLDGIFIGRGDLSVALEASSPNDDVVMSACARIAAAGLAAGKNVSAFVANATEAQALAKIGITTFMFGSDQSLLLQAAKQASSDIRSIAGGHHG